MVEASRSMRIDADYFRPDYLEIQEKLSQQGCQPLQNFRVEIRHPREIARNYVESGALFLRAQNVRPMAVDLTSNPVFVSDADAEKLSENVLTYKDILITRTGHAGQCAIYLEDSKVIVSSHTFIVRCDDINPFYLTVYLNSKYGKALIDKGRYGSLQPEIAPQFLRQILVPVFDDIPLEIEKVYLRSQDLIQQAKASYAAAQTTLLSELNLADWQPKQQSTFVQNFADLGRAGRMDSDYFQPKYGEIVAAIKGYPGGWATLDNLVTMQRCIEVGSGEYLDEGIPFVRVSNLSPFDLTEEKYISASLYSEIAQHQPQQGEILLTKDATPGIAHYLSEPPPPMIPSGGILRLRGKTDQLNNECLTLILNSLLTKEQANRDAGGSVIMHWRPEQIAEVVIPIITPQTQAEIQAQVAESSALRRQSRQLLDLAKGAVELAIEQDETAALAWLEREMGELLTGNSC